LRGKRLGPRLTAALRDGVFATRLQRDWQPGPSIARPARPLPVGHARTPNPMSNLPSPGTHHPIRDGCTVIVGWDCARIADTTDFDCSPCRVSRGRTPPLNSSGIASTGAAFPFFTSLPLLIRSGHGTFQLERNDALLREQGFELQILLTTPTLSETRVNINVKTASCLSSSLSSLIEHQIDCTCVGVP
jgi:hypothetical protein